MPDKYCVAALTRPSGAVLPLLRPVATWEEARDEMLDLFDLKEQSNIARNYTIVVAQMVNGKWRPVEEAGETERLGPSDIAAIEAEERAYAAGRTT